MNVINMNDNIHHNASMRRSSIQTNCSTFAEQTISSCSSLFECNADDGIAATFNNQNHRFSYPSAEDKSKVLLKHIRRKNKNFKELVANFWTLDQASSSSSVAPLKSNQNSSNLPRRRSSNDSFGGLFHPIDLSSPSTNDSGGANATMNIRSLPSALPSAPISSMALSVDLFQPSSDAIEDLLTPNPVPSAMVSLPNSCNNSVHNSDENNTVASSSAIISSAAAIISCSDYGNYSLHQGMGSNHPDTVHSNSRSTSGGVQPGPYDIVCGRNSGAYNYIGNRRFRVTIEMNLQRYIDSPTREDKTNVIKSIVWMLHNDVGARFLKKETIKSSSGKKNSARFTVMTDKQAREKVGHALRDLVIMARKERQEKEQQRRRQQQQELGC